MHSTHERLGTTDRPMISCHIADTGVEEATHVIKCIEKLVPESAPLSSLKSQGERSTSESFHYKDIAILYREEAHGKAMRKALAKAGVPYQHRTHGSLLDNPLMQELLHAMEGGDSDIPLIDQLSAALLTLDDALAGPELYVLAASLKPIAQKCEADYDQFLAAVSRCADMDLWDPHVERVSLLTFPAAERLVFPIVFLVGCEDATLQYTDAGDTDKKQQEARRQFFCGMTRAKERIYLSYANRREWRGQLRDMAPSPFLQDIENELLKWQLSDCTKQTKPSHQQLELL